ncbi:MAG: hypothetical protein ACNA8W_04605 [Bradymonadaceae bacterium]
MQERTYRAWIWILALCTIMMGWGPSALAQEEASSAEPSREEIEGSPPVSRGIEIDVRVGARRVLVPLAVPDTLQPGGDTQGAAASVQELLRRNLDLAGFFKVLPTDSFFFDPSQEGMGAGDINFQNWFNVGV